MSRYVEKYRKIVNALIRKGFPELKGKKIIFFDFIFFKRYAAQVLDFCTIKLILLNHEKLKGLSKEEFVGLFAHELCHFIVYSQKNLFQKLVFILSMIFSKKVSSTNERNTDLLVIKKGYGKELLKLALRRKKRYSKERLSKIYDSGYLPPNKIKYYMKKFKK